MSGAMAANRKALNDAIADVLSEFDAVPTHGLGAELRVQAGLGALIALEDVCAHPDEDAYPRLIQTFARLSELGTYCAAALPHLLPKEDVASAEADEHGRTAELFQTAWTTYDTATYDHSVGLMEERLRRSGFGGGFFRGKTCFDGGCGTGRFSVAMAKAGARKVVAVDIGSESLAYLAQTRSRYALDTIEAVRHDVTDLSPFPSDAFDFVASQGVLHHTPQPDRGIREHFRITRPGGTFWLYLYGAGGFYWDAYDQLRPLVRALDPRTIRAILTRFGVRKGLIYTFLDNLMAPRVYYRLNQVLDLLRPLGDFDYAPASGSSPIDDPAMLLATRCGRDIFGPDGEIRLVITKKASSR
jgi:ubiquinone/menaquinone biosynthesis C-methylase UbiE